MAEMLIGSALAVVMLIVFWAILLVMPCEHIATRRRRRWSRCLSCGAFLRHPS